MAPNDVRGLGSYMRHIGMRLTSDTPMTFEMAHEIIRIRTWAMQQQCSFVCTTWHCG